MRNRKEYKRGPNNAELSLEDLMDLNKIKYSRRGYPDYTVIKDGKIVGFIEVKPNKDKELRAGQILFREFCERSGINFYKWSPNEPLPDWAKSS